MADIYQKIADHLLTSKDRDGNWTPPWHKRGLNLPSNATSGRTYNGINVLSLWVSEQRFGFATGLWATYQQWQDAGAQVAKGMKGTPIVFYKRYGSEEDPDAQRWVARGYTVFNRDQVLDAPPLPELPAPNSDERMVEVELFIGSVKEHATIIERESDRAYYNPEQDHIVIPTYEQFVGAEAYYGTLLHELTHWTGAAGRQHREFGKRFGDSAYALEELVAELGATFLCADLGIESEPRPDHAAYIGHWHKVLSEDPQAFAHAVAQARKATDYVKNLVPLPAECDSIPA